MHSGRDQSVDWLRCLDTKTVIRDCRSAHKESNEEPISMTEHHTGYRLQPAETFQMQQYPTQCFSVP